jgi:hypothetical protein
MILLEGVALWAVIILVLAMAIWMATHDKIPRDRTMWPRHRSHVRSDYTSPKPPPKWMLSPGDTWNGKTWDGSEWGACQHPRAYEHPAGRSRRLDDPR